MSVHNKIYVKNGVFVDGIITVDDLDSHTTTTLLIGKSTATKVEIADTGVITEIQGNLDVLEGLDVTGIVTTDNYVQFSDISAPANPADGEGRLYKKTGDDGLFWKPDSAGVEVDLTQTGGGGGVFGSEYQYAESSAVSSNSTGTFQQKLRLTTSSLAGGTYRIGWYYNWNHDDKKSNFEGRVQIDDTTTIHSHYEEPHEDNAQQLQTVCGFYHGTLSSGVHTIDIDYRGTNDTSSLSNARIEIWRVQ